jgi:hypothetical protein
MEINTDISKKTQIHFKAQVITTVASITARFQEKDPNSF